MASVYKRKYTYADGTVRYAKKWTIDYVDKDGKTRTIAGYKDKKMSEDLGRQLEKNAERERAGLPPAPLTDPIKNDRYGSGHAQRRQPLAGTIAHYLADLACRGTPTTSTHYRETKRMLHHLADQCRWECLADVRADAFTTFLARLAEAGRAPRTQNRYHETLRAFLNWCVQQDWLDDSPIAKLKMVPQSGKGRRRLRRAYTLEEWARLLASVDGKDREVVYRVASYTGFRRRTLGQLQKQDCTPTGDRPCWHVRAVCFKNGRAMNVPMLPECAALLRPLWEALPAPTSRLLPKPPPAITLREDLRRANIARQDDGGRWADFHSFRYFFCKMMGERLPIQKVKTLMGHSTIKLTADLYGELGMEDVAEDVWSLPSLLPIAVTAKSTANDS